ncbi:hypothetical protein OUZ56_016990 [Daphnia magna]|uniref:THAP-type domain-containing protein n=1 Tax=Daphnia magna TaxID=35525 RepID=A0ABR0ARV9_9CRUS|nr:hypothetical protein OUZ56_016990 [Daphnia magna]
MPDRCYVPGCKSGFPDYPKYLGKFTMFSAPKDGKLLKRWNEFILRKGTLKPSSKIILPKVVFRISRYALRGKIGKMMTNPDAKASRRQFFDLQFIDHDATVPFFYVDRRVGGLGTCRLPDDADIWTIARAAQLLTCRDHMVRNIYREQLHDTIRRGFRNENPGVLPVGEYFSGSMDEGLCRLRYAEAGSNLWTLACQDLLESLLVKQGHDVTINNAIPGQSLRPDVEFQLSGSRVMVDVVVCYDQPGSLENAYQRKYDKYSSHGRVLPLVVGSHGSWYPRNDEIRSILGINGRSLDAFRFKARLAAIQRSIEMVCALFHHGATNPEAEEIPPAPIENPYPVTSRRTSLELPIEYMDI